MSSTITILDPAAPPGIAETQGVFKPLETLQGKVVGFIDNAKPNFNHPRRRSRRAAGREVRRARASSSTASVGASVPAPERVDATTLASECDARHHRLGRLRVLHVVECPRQCRSREAGHARADGLLDRVPRRWAARSANALGDAGPADRGDAASVRPAHARRGARDRGAVRRRRSRGSLTGASRSSAARRSRIAQPTRARADRGARRSRRDQPPLPRARAGATGCRSCRRRASASSAMLAATQRAPRRDRRAHRAGLRRGDGRAHRDQRGHGGLRARISAGADRGGRSGRRARSSICRASRRRPIPRRRVAHRQRPDRADARRQRRRQLPGAGHVGERDARPRAAARAAEHRRRAAGRDGPRDARPAGQVHVLLRRERGGEPVGAAARRARIRRASRARSRSSARPAR